MPYLVTQLDNPYLLSGNSTFCIIIFVLPNAVESHRLYFRFQKIARSNVLCKNPQLFWNKWLSSLFPLAKWSYFLYPFLKSSTCSPLNILHFSVAPQQRPFNHLKLWDWKLDLYFYQGSDGSDHMAETSTIRSMSCGLQWFASAQIVSTSPIKPHLNEHSTQRK